MSGSDEDAYRPFAYALPLAAFSYLHECRHKGELRRDNARQLTVIAQSNYADQERALLFMLRSAFIQVLQAKAVLVALVTGETSGIGRATAILDSTQGFHVWHHKETDRT